MGFMDYMPQFGQNVDQQMPQDDTLTQLDLKRKLALADSLRQQQMPEGQMVSGRYVAPAWTQMLANTLGKVQASNMEKEAYKKYGEAQASKQAKLAEALGQYEKDLMPRTEQAPQQPTTVMGSTGEMAPNMGMVNAPARQVPVTANDRYSALLKLSAATNNPELMQKAILGRVDYANKAEETAGEREFRQQQTKNEQEFQRLQMKERQGFELTQGEKQFANQMALQKSSQGFQAGENAKNRANQIELHNASQNAAPSGYKKNADGSLTFIPGGPADPSTKPLTEGQANARVYGERMANSHNIVNNLEADGKLKYDPLAVRTIISGPTGISDITYGYANKDTQSAAQAMRDFINATLRRESGASISAGEYDTAIKQYFPQPGESKKVTAQKRTNREIAIRGIQAAGGQTGKEIKVNY